MNIAVIGIPINSYKSFTGTCSLIDLNTVKIPIIDSHHICIRPDIIKYYKRLENRQKLYKKRKALGRSL